MAIKKFNAVAGLSVGENVIFEVIDSAANVSAANLTVSGSANLGSSSNVKITGGISGYVLSTDGTGNLSWVNNDSGVAGSNSQIQFNNSGAFGADSNLTFNTTTDTLNTKNIILEGSGSLTNGNLVSANFFTGTLTTSAQPNITQVGSLANLTVTGNITTGNLSGANLVSANFVTGTLTTAAQPNITQVGSLTNLTVTGNISTGNLSGANLVSANFFTGTLTTSAQPNITQIGSLATLTVTGNITTGNLSGANLVSANFFTGTLTTSAQPNITSLGTLSSLAVTGTTVLTGNLTIDGTVANLSVGNLSIQDNLIDLSAETTGTPSNNAGLRIIRGDELSVQLRWNESLLNWQFTNDGTNYLNIAGTTAAGNLSVNNANLGNLATANFFSGNGSLLTGITSTTVSASAQPNITSLGTLTSLSVSGNITAGNANLGNLVVANFFSGSGNLLSNIQAANINGVIGNSNYAAFAGNVVNSSQPNITSVGTLTGLNVSGISNVGVIGNVKITGGLAGYTIVTDGFGNLSWTAASGGGGGGFTNITKDTFNGTGVQTTFNLTATPSSTDAVQVVINGLVQLETAYNVVGSTVVFANPPLNGQRIEVTVYGVSQLSAMSGQVTYAANGNFEGSNSFTFNSSTNTLSITNVTSTGNVAAGNIRTNNILYANGDPYVFTTSPAGSNTQIQFNDGGIFAGSANLTFNKTSNTFITQNITAANAISVTNGTITLSTGTIAVSAGAAGIFNTGVSNINFGITSNITLGSTTGNVTVQNNLLVSNTATITNLKVSDVFSNRTPITVVTNTVIDSFSVNKYRSAKYTMRVNSDDGYQAVEVLLIHDNANSYVTIYGSLSTIGTDIISLTTDVSSSNVRLLATTGSANTTVNLLGTYIAD